jgi:thioredoxin reductase (NADPH)
VPRTFWLEGSVDLDDHGFINTSKGKLPFETSIPGVFAAGDVRSGSTKRIAAAIGEGSAALQMVHQYLDN